MSLAIYFTKPADTAIAAQDTTFIEALQQTASTKRVFQVADRPDTADVVLIDERYQYRTWRYADELARCSFVRRHAERLCVVNHDDHARVFLPGLYVSLERSRSPLVRARSIPYKWDLWHVPVPDSFVFEPERLFIFRGAFHTHPVRKRLSRVLSRTDQGTCEELQKGLHSHDQGDQERYIEEILGARFSLCPRGISPSTYRLYESMQLGRCPVVISDDWIAPPGPDWRKFAVFVAETEIKSLPEILMRETEQAHTRGRAAFEAWQEFFSWPRRWEYFLEQIRNLQEDQQRAHGFSELQELWAGRAFRRPYRWTLSGRAVALVSRKLRAVTARPTPKA